MKECISKQENLPNLLLESEEGANESHRSLDEEPQGEQSNQSAEGHCGRRAFGPQKQIREEEHAKQNSIKVMIELEEKTA